MKFYQLVGNAALGSRLRRLSHIINNDAKKIYALYEVQLEPHWFPVFFMLMEENTCCISDIAKDTGLARSAVSKVAKEMEQAGLLSSAKGDKDSRVSYVTLTARGKKEAEKLKPQILDVSTSVNHLFLEAGVDLWGSLNAIEKALERKGIHKRIQNTLKKREGKLVKIIPFNSSHANAFKALNLDWIEDYWEVEPKDLEMLNNPKETIIEQGGVIVIATIDNVVVGTCALLKTGEKHYELAKMTVKKEVRRKGIGSSLATTVMDQSRKLGAKSITLECNSLLISALSLYEKLGFEYVPFASSVYSRCNVQMKINLTKI